MQLSAICWPISPVRSVSSALVSPLSCSKSIFGRYPDLVASPPPKAGGLAAQRVPQGDPGLAQDAERTLSDYVFHDQTVVQSNCESVAHLLNKIHSQ